MLNSKMNMNGNGNATSAECIENLKKQIRLVNDFPKPGIAFRDIFPLFQSPSCVKSLISELANLANKHVKSTGEKIDVVIGLDARGFLLGPMLAVELGAAFAPVRKRGKLPGDVISISYELEYRKDELEMQKDAVKPGQVVLVVDDLIATGGSMEASCQLVKILGGKVTACLVVIELTYLDGRARVEKSAPVLSLLQFSD